MVKIYKCAKCDWEWASKQKQSPKVCPKCKKPYWDSERKKKNE